MKQQATFVREFVRSPKRIGAVWPSSKWLAQTMVEWVAWDSVSTVAEYGPGNGAFTPFIQDRLRPGARYIGIEQNGHLAAEFARKFPELELAVDSAANIREICNDHKIESIDAVICGLPWAAWDETIQVQILDAMLSFMSPGAQFTTFAYLQGVILPGGRTFGRLLTSRFTDVTRSKTVWTNVPPAFAYRCKV